MKKLITTLGILVITSVTITINGCANPIKEHLAYPDMQGEKGVKITSFQAQYQGNVLRVRAEVANTNKKNARIFYRFRWLDGQGNVIEAQEQWKPVLIYGKQSAFIIDAAPHPDVVDYRLEFNVEYPLH